MKPRKCLFITFGVYVVSGGGLLGVLLFFLFHAFRFVPEDIHLLQAHLV